LARVLALVPHNTMTAYVSQTYLGIRAPHLMTLNIHALLYKMYQTSGCRPPWTTLNWWKWVKAHLINQLFLCP